jgi:hypothetical protein
MRNQFPHPYKIRGKSIFLCILIIIFLDSKWEDKIFITELYINNRVAALPFSRLLLQPIWFQRWKLMTVARQRISLLQSQFVFAISLRNYTSY